MGMPKIAKLGRRQTDYAPQFHVNSQHCKPYHNWNSKFRTSDPCECPKLQDLTHYKLRTSVACECPKLQTLTHNKLSSQNMHTSGCTPLTQNLFSSKTHKWKIPQFQQMTSKMLKTCSKIIAHSPNQSTHPPNQTPSHANRLATNLIPNLFSSVSFFLRPLKLQTFQSNATTLQPNLNLLRWY